MRLVTWWQSVLIIFIVGGLAVIVVTGFRRWRANRVNPDLREAYWADYGKTMGGNWTSPIPDPHPIVAEEPFDEQPASLRHAKFGELPARVVPDDLIETKAADPPQDEPPEPQFRREWGGS